VTLGFDAELVFYLFTNDGEVIGRFDSDAYDSLSNPYNRYRDILADEDLLADFSGEYKHRAIPSRKGLQHPLLRNQDSNDSTAWQGGIRAILYRGVRGGRYV
jgi:hypothetical protein